MKRFVLHYYFSLILFVLFNAPAAIAQGTMPLKASYQGAFLPEDTEIIVLQKPATIRQGNLYQPEMLTADAYPQNTDLFLRRDTLNSRRQTRTTYPTTQSSGQLYFIYALTSDSTLYWSFSAPNSLPKFDVVNTGVMSVAPVGDETRFRRILDVFFTGPILVVDTSIETEAISDSVAGPRDSLSLTESGDTALPSTAALDSSYGDQVDPESLEANVLPGVNPSAVDQTTAKRGIPYWLFFLLLSLFLALSIALFYFVNAYRNELIEVRTELISMRMHMRPVHPDKDRELERKLAKAEERLQETREENQLIKARYLVLEQELNSLQEERNNGNEGASV